MSKASARTVQTPGEAPPDETLPGEPKPDAFTANLVQTGMEDQDDEPSEVERLRAQVEAQGQMMADMMAAMQNLLRANQGNGANPSQSESHLLDASEVDMAKLQAPVLTRQGWLVPPDYGMSPEDKADRERQRMTDKALQALAARA